MLGVQEVVGLKMELRSSASSTNSVIGAAIATVNRFVEYEVINSKVTRLLTHCYMQSPDWAFCVTLQAYSYLPTYLVGKGFQACYQPHL
jgi:hypothetical protein